jgi:hypothetical protein
MADYSLLAKLFIIVIVGLLVMFQVNGALVLLSYVDQTDNKFLQYVPNANDPEYLCMLQNNSEKDFLKLSKTFKASNWNVIRWCVGLGFIQLILMLGITMMSSLDKDPTSGGIDDWSIRGFFLLSFALLTVLLSINDFIGNANKYEKRIRQDTTKDADGNDIPLDSWQIDGKGPELGFCFDIRCRNVKMTEINSMAISWLVFAGITTLLFLLFLWKVDVTDITRRLAIRGEADLKAGVPAA